MQVAAAILPEENFSSATRAHAEGLRAPATQTSSAVAVMPKTRWQKQLEEMQDKVCWVLTITYGKVGYSHTLMSYVLLLLPSCWAATHYGSPYYKYISIVE